jgi:hypothetical protein
MPDSFKWRGKSRGYDIYVDIGLLEGGFEESSDRFMVIQSLTDAGELMASKLLSRRNGLRAVF